jgi:hypothetical protein
MLTLNQYLKLQRGDQVRLYREVYTVNELVDEGTHVERVLVSESGDVVKNGVYIVHLMVFHGSTDLPENETAPVVVNHQAMMPAKAAMSSRDQALLEAYERAELI